MKKKIDELNWRSAFREAPDSFRDAALKAALSVQEDRPARRASSFSLRPLLLAALLVAALTSAAIAADALLGLGWLDYLKSEFQVSAPDSAGKVMLNAEPMIREIGPVTFTAQETLSDGHIAVSTILARMTDGTPALFTTDPYQSIGSGRYGEDYARSLGLSPDVTWLDGAKQLNRPLYFIRAILDLSPEYVTEPTMEDSLMNADGSLSMYSMAPLSPNTFSGELPVSFFLMVASLDPATGETVASWRETVEATIPLQPMLDEKTYAPQGAFRLDGYAIERVHAARYSTGAYLTLFVTAPSSATPEDLYAHAFSSFLLTDDAGQPLPAGMAFQMSIDASQWPRAAILTMVSVDALPETLHISNGTETLTLK